MTGPTPAIPPWFFDALRDFLASWRQEMPAEVARAYWDTLSDLDQGDVLTAGLELRRSAGGEFPPSAARWYETARRMGRERRLKDTIELGRERYWKAECEDCDDTGAVIHECTAANRCGRPICERADESHTHTWASVCPCRPTNSTYQRKQDRQRSIKRGDEARS